MSMCGNVGTPISMQSAPDMVARTDYAANDGSTGVYWWFGSPSDPATLTQGDDPNWAKNWHSEQNGWTPPMNGISYERSEVEMGWITDGVSNTIFCGEKYMGPDWYYTGTDPADNENMYVGFDNDTHRSTYSPPMRDTPGYGDMYRFGSAHYGAAHFSMCDGSVRRISYSVDPPTFQNLGSRNDGQTIDLSKL